MLYLISGLMSGGLKCVWALLGGRCRGCIEYRDRVSGISIQM